MGKFHKSGGAKQGVQVQKNLHSVHKTIHKNKKQKSVSKNKNVASILQNGKSKVKDVAGMLSDVVEERKMNLGKDLKKGKENIPAKFDSKESKKMKKKGKHEHVASPQQSPPQKKKPFQKDVVNGGKHSQKQVQQDNCVGKPKRDLNNKNKKKKQKQTVRKNYVLLRQPSSSEDEDEDEEAAADNETSVKLEHLNATLGSSTDSDDDEFDPKEESDAEMSDAHSGDSVVSDDIADLSGDDSTEEKVLEDGGDESDSDEDDDNDDESDQVEKNESLKVQHLNATLPSSDDEDEEYVPDKDEAKLKSPKKKKNTDESLNLTALENTINSSDEDDDDYVPDASVGEVQDDSSDADSDEEESDDEEEDESVATKKAPKRKAKEEEEDSDEDFELENTVAIEGKANDTKEIKEYLASLKPFDEKAFREIVSTESVKKIVEALLKQVKEEMSKKKDKIFTDYRYILQVTSFKIPKCPRRMAKLRLTHSLISDDDDVCFIVRDLERGRKVDYEETVQHYEELFAEKGIKGIKAIMPFNQIRNEYKTYESKIKLSNLYDYYLCDGAIVGHVVGFLGKHFQKPRSTPYAVRMDNKDLAAEVQKAMHKTSFKQNNKGPTIAIPVGHCHMNTEQITENIMTIVDQLKENYPGGLENIRNMNIKINLTGTSSLPIYISFCRPPVSVPNVVGPKEKHLKEIKKKTNEILQKFSMTQTGELVKLDAEQVLKRKKEVKAATKAKKAKLEEGEKKSPTKTEDKSPSKDGKTKSDKEDVAEEKEANKSLNVGKKEKSNKDKSLNVSKKEKTKDKSLDVSKKERVSPKKESQNEKSKKKKLQEVEDDEESDEEDDEHKVEDDDDEDDSDEEGGDDNEDEDDEDEDEDDGDDDDDDDEDEE